MNSKTIKELRRISSRIPEEMLDRLMVEKDVAPVVKEVLERACKDKDVPKKLRDKYRNIIDAGYIDLKEMIVDEDVQKEVDEWVENEIDKAIKLGRIPDPKVDKELQAYTKKSKQWIRKNTKKD